MPTIPLGATRRQPCWPASRKTSTLVLQAIGLVRAGGFSFWDALIVRAAQSAGAEVLFTEDMQAGRRIDNVLIQSPFSDSS